LGDVSIGRESSVWYNAVLRGDNAAITIEGMEVPPGSLVVGVPGRVVRVVDEKLSERAARNWAHYVQQAQHHRRGNFSPSL